MLSMIDKAQIITTIGTGIAIIAVIMTLVGEVRQDIRDIRADMRDIRADIRQVSSTAKADSDKNKDLITSHLTTHAVAE